MKYLRLLPLIIVVVLVSVLTGCSTANLSTANAQWSRGEYFAAAGTYRKIYAKTSSTKARKLKGEIAYQIGRCYTMLRSASRSSAAYQNAIRYRYADSTVYLHLAKSFHQEGKYPQAINNYDIYLQYRPQDTLAIFGKQGAVLSNEWKRNPTRHKIKKMDLFNSRRADFSPMFFGRDKDQLYITSSNDKAVGDNPSLITGIKNNDIFLSKKNERGQWERPEIVEGELNSPFDEGTPTFSPDESTMYLSMGKSNPESASTVQIYMSKRTAAAWAKPTLLDLVGDTITMTAHPAASPDGQWLYFVSDMAGGFGGKDLWRAPVTDEGFGNYENLGPEINTIGDELFPTFRSDGTLFFSSDGHPGMGGLDLFMAKETESGWMVENLKSPINSPADDFGMTFETNDRGFFSSNRMDARGYDNIYSFELPTLQILIQGYVIDMDEEPIEEAWVRIVGKNGMNKRIAVKKDGTFKVELDRGIDYVMMASAKGFLNSKQEFRTDSTEEDATYDTEFILASITKPVLVEHIFFEFNKATLTPESTTSLLELVKMLEDNPNVTIELSAHTDARGTETYNQSLSERRAKSVVDFLIEKGIESDRLTPKGYGEGKPKVVTKKIAKQYPFMPEGQLLDETFIQTLSPEQQEIAHSINRRIEFQVLKTTYRLY